jgi:UDP:flavonoid glycosyltransferase YjiC (YdhE family)
LSLVRILVTSTAGDGHLSPLIPFVAALRSRGDEVLVVVPPSAAERARRTGAGVCLVEAPPADALADAWARFVVAPAAEAAVIANREIFGRLCTAAMLPTVDEVCRTWRPAAVLHEAAEFAGPIVADRYGIPHLQVAISLADVEAASLELAAPVLEPYGVGVTSRIHSSPYLSRFPAELDPSPYPRTFRYRMDSIGPDPAAMSPDWWPGSVAPLVYITFGTVTGSLDASDQLYRAAIVAVGALDARVLLTTGRGHTPDLGPLPPQVHVEEWVEQVDVLREASAVVCHGGSGTVLGALAGGVPMVMVAMFADQPANARRVVDVGAGLLLTQPAGSANDRAFLDKVAVRELRIALHSVLTQDTFRDAARKIAHQSNAAPDVAAVLFAALGDSSAVTGPPP